MPGLHINTSSVMEHDVSPISTPSISRRNSAVSAISALSSPNVSPISSPVFSPAYPSGSPNGLNSKMSDTATTPSIGRSSNFDADDWFGRFRDDLDISDECPDRGTLAAAGEVNVYDVQGNARNFKSFFTGLDAIGDRQLVIFVRHFYCGACQAYLKALSKEITMQAYYTMPVPTSIIVIGCGSPDMIPHYKAATGCPFPIFAEPSRRLYKILGMGLSVNIGSKRPTYMKEISPPAWLAEQIRQLSKYEGKRGTRFRSGNWLQIGGEFLFQDGQAVWCHRMKNYRNHADINVIKRVLEIEE